MNEHITNPILQSSLDDFLKTQQAPQMMGALGMRTGQLFHGEIPHLVLDISQFLIPRNETANETQVAPPPPPPPPVLDKIELDSGYVGFSGGVPVSGTSHLSLFPNGAYSFTGHFRDSGAPSYDISFVWLIKTNAGTIFTFSHTGRTHGTFEAGSRDNDWGDSNINPALAAAWSDISIGYTWSWNAGANFDLGQLIDAAVKGIGQVGAVIAIVG